MDKKIIINTIRNNYIYYDDLEKNLTNKLDDLIGVEDSKFHRKFQDILDEIQDPHFKLIGSRKSRYTLPVYLGIFMDDIIVVEDSVNYPTIKKGLFLEGIDDIKISDFLKKYKKYNTLSLKLMKILEGLTTRDSYGEVTFHFRSDKGNIITEKVEYTKCISAKVDMAEYWKSIEDYSVKIQEKYGVVYYPFPSLMDELGVKRLKTNLERTTTENLILFDLRNNMGGRIDYAIDLVRFFVNDNTNIFLKSRAGIKKHLLIPEKSNVRGKKIGMLFNNLTCSSLEFVFLRYVQNIENIYLMGIPTCGMLDVATLYNLDEKHTLSLSTKKYVDENGNSIKERCIEPDIYINRGVNDIVDNRDTQLEKALEFLRKGG